MSCAISAGALTFPPTFDKCLEFKDDQKLVEDDGHIRDYCGKRCARKAEALPSPAKKIRIKEYKIARYKHDPDYAKKMRKGKRRTYR